MISSFIYVFGTALSTATGGTAAKNYASIEAAGNNYDDENDTGNNAPSNASGAVGRNAIYPPLFL